MKSIKHKSFILIIILANLAFVGFLLPIKNITAETLYGYRIYVQGYAVHSHDTIGSGEFVFRTGIYYSPDDGGELVELASEKIKDVDPAELVPSDGSWIDLGLHYFDWDDMVCFNLHEDD